MFGSPGADPTVTTFVTNSLLYNVPSGTFVTPNVINCVGNENDILSCPTTSAVCNNVATQAAAIKCLPPQSNYALLVKKCV